MKPSLVRGLTLIPATALVVTNVIGTGVGGHQLRRRGSPPAWAHAAACPDRRQRADHRPLLTAYRVWGYPFVTALFLLGTAYLMLNELLSTPGRALAGVAIVALGLPLYAYYARRLPPSRPQDWLAPTEPALADVDVR